MLVKVGPQRDAAHACRLFDRQYAFRRNTRPVRNGGLRNAEFFGKRADPAGDADRFLQT
jgi:hypothetical protein